MLLRFIADLALSHADLAHSFKSILTIIRFYLTRDNIRRVTKLMNDGGVIKYVDCKVSVKRRSTAQKFPRELRLKYRSTKEKVNKIHSVRTKISASKVASKLSPNSDYYKTSAGKENEMETRKSLTCKLLLDNNMGKPPRTPTNTNSSTSFFKTGKGSESNSGKHTSTPPDNAEKKLKTKDQLEDELLNPSDSESKETAMEVDKSPSQKDDEGQANSGDNLTRKKPITWQVNVGEGVDKAVTTSREYVDLERRLTAERSAKAQAEIREADLRQQVAKMQETLDALLTNSTPVAQETNTTETLVTNQQIEEGHDLDALWQLPMDSSVEEAMVIHYRNYPDKIFDNEEFASLQKSLSEAHQKAKGGSLNFRIIVDDLALKQGVAVARCRNVGTIIWISHMIPRLNENLRCVKVNRIKLSPAFKIWASGTDITFETIKEGVMDHEIDSSGWKLIKVREPNSRAKVQGVDALFLGDENLKKLVRSYESRQCLVQFRLGGPKARIQSLLGIDEVSDGSNGEIEQVDCLMKTKTTLFKEIKRPRRLKQCKSRVGSKKPTPASCSFSLPTRSNTRVTLRGYSTPGRMEKLKYFEFKFLLRYPRGYCSTIKCNLRAKGTSERLIIPRNKNFLKYGIEINPALAASVIASSTQRFNNPTQLHAILHSRAHSYLISSRLTKIHSVSLSLIQYHVTLHKHTQLYSAVLILILLHSASNNILAYLAKLGTSVMKEVEERTAERKDGAMSTRRFHKKHS